MNIRHNMRGITAQRYQSENVKKQNKTLEKLSSGLRVNIAADDAAVLSISQKMRAQIIGYSVGENNAADGIGFLNTADGAMMEVATMMDRMKQLTMESLNGTYTDDERTLIEMEFESLQTETDRILKGSKFNGLNLFEQHENTYYSISGNRKWDYDLLHKIDNFNNELILNVKNDSGNHRLSITVPEGIYTTQELADEIDDALDKQAPAFPGFTMEFDTQGVFHFHYEGGTMINEIGGGLSYLLYDSYGGNGYGMLLGTTQFEAGWPLNVTSQNNELEFYVEDYTGTSTQIKMYVPPGGYTREEMILYLNSQLKKNGYEDVKASEYGSKCIQVGGDGYIVTGLKGNMFEIDDGIKYTSVFYDNTKYGTIYNTSGYVNGQAYYTTDPTDTAHNRVNITAANDTLQISVDGGAMKTIQLAAGSYTVGDVVNMLNQAFTDQGIGAKASVRRMGGFESLTITSDHLGSNSSIGLNVNSSAYKTLFSHTEYYQKNNVRPQDGIYATIAPTLTGAAVLPFPVTINDTNNQLNFLVDGSNLPIKLDNGTYADMTALLTQLNKQLKDNGPLNGTNPKLQAVDVSGAVRITTTADGGDIDSVKFGAPPGNGYDSLFSVSLVVPKSVWINSNGAMGKYPEISLDFNMNGSNVIDATNDTFVLYINGQKKEIKIPQGTYTPEKLAEIITNGFPKTNETIPNRFGTLHAVGSEKMQEGTTIPSELKPATITFPFGLDDTTVIDGSNNEFKLNVNGNDVSVTLASGSYSRDDLVAEMNRKFAAQGIGVNVSLDQDRLKLTTTAVGKSASLTISSTSGGSAMDVLSGTSDIVISGVTAVIIDGKMILRGGDDGAGTSLLYKGDGNSASIFSGTEIKKFDANAADRVTKKENAYIQGYPLTEPIAITAANKELQFKYDGGYGAVTIDFTLDEKNYLFAELEAALQQKIDAVLNSQTPPLTNHLKVKTDQNGVRIEATTAGAQYKLSDFSKNFHEVIISGSRLISKDYNPIYHQGQQIATPAYIVGRQDVRNRTVKIQGGINDTLKLDFSYPDQTGAIIEMTLELTLAEGSYQGNSLSSMIQSKISDELDAKGLPRDLIEVKIGGISTGVVGADDENALNFTLNTNKLPNSTNGSCKIDGIRGNAAFYIFYKTEGEPIPAYITGTKDLTKGVVIPADKNDFNFRIAGKLMEILIPPGNYTSAGIIDAINQCLTDKNIPIKAALKDGCLNLSFNTLGNNKITDVGGGARGLIFFQEEGRIDEDTDLILQVGPEFSDEFRVKKEILNTCFMKINSLCITTKKYATKSSDRLDEAIRILGKSQGSYGAYTNRLEHVIAANAVARENLTASESRMRDADMAKEMMANIKNNILVQSSMAMMAQANQSGQDVLKLLQ